MMQMFKMFDFDPMPPHEVEFSRKLIRLLIDWGKEGKPPSYLPDWQPLDLDNPNYLEIDELFTVRKGLPDQERLDFWRNHIEPVYWRHVLQLGYHDEL